MQWKIDFYSTRVMEEIQSWPVGIRVKYAWIVELLKKHGPREVGMPHVELMGQGLFEIRAKGQEGIGRAFFCMTDGRLIIILCGIIKKTQKTPRATLILARQRMKEVKKQ